MFPFSTENNNNDNNNDSGYCSGIKFASNKKVHLLYFGEGSAVAW